MWGLSQKPCGNIVQIVCGEYLEYPIQRQKDIMCGDLVVYLKSHL